MVQSSESLPGVVTTVRPTHEVFDDQSDVDEADAVVRGQVSLENQKELIGNHSSQTGNRGRKKERQRAQNKSQVIHTHFIKSISLAMKKKRDYHIHLEVDPTEPWIFSLGKNT